MVTRRLLELIVAPAVTVLLNQALREGDDVLLIEDPSRMINLLWLSSFCSL